jgi:hypothetical protein
MAIYAYTYSGFPDGKDRKYYVCNYRKGNAYTYQVVPQLQREFDERGYGDKTRIDYDRFKKLRRNGYLYTSNSKQKRRPLHAAEESGEVPDHVERLGGWLTGEVWPGEVDWEALGAEIRQNLEAGRPLPPALREIAGEFETGDGESFADRYARMRDRHVEAVWFHLWTPDDVVELEIEGRQALRASEVASHGNQPRLFDVVRETRVEVEPLSEAACLERLSESVGEGYFGNWEEVFERLGPEDGWYETIESADGPMRIPADALYDLQWALADQLEALQLNHATAPALEVDSPRPLHARFHAGARQALVLRLADYTVDVVREALTGELRREADGGRLVGWSDRGIEALGRLLVDPQMDRPSPSAATSEFVSEFTAWGGDEAIRRGLDEKLPDGHRWSYSRLHDEIVVSTLDEHDAETWEEARCIVGAALDQTGWHRDPAGQDQSGWHRDPEVTDRWEAGGEEPLVVGGLEVPADRGQTLGLVARDRDGLEEGAARARGGEATDADRKRLEVAYRRTGDLRYRTLAAPTFGADARKLLRAIVVSDFEEALWEGWIGT